MRIGGFMSFVQETVIVSPEARVAWFRNDGGGNRSGYSLLTVLNNIVIP